MCRLALTFFVITMSMFIRVASPAMISQPDIGKVVTFIFSADEQGNLQVDSKSKNPIPYRTGFFVLVKNENGGPRGYGYLVTDKHALKSPQGTGFSKIFVRLNKLTGDAEFTPVDLIVNGQSIVYTHPDSTVDIAVIPVAPLESIHDFKTIPDDWLATKELPGIGEGSDVFFVGLFTTYYGEHKNNPIFRFGLIAMIPEDRLQLQDKTDIPSV